MELPEIFCWVQWCYCHPVQLWFGQHVLFSTSGVQHGDPLGPLLFSLTLLELLKTIHIPAEITLNIWYSNDGILIGPRAVLADILVQIQSQGSQFCPLLNKKKCEEYWPSEDTDFLDLPPEIIHLKEGVSLLGSPVWGTPQYMVVCVTRLVIYAQEEITKLDDPQVELYLLRSCASVYKINHIL